MSTWGCRIGAWAALTCVLGLARPAAAAGGLVVDAAELTAAERAQLDAGVEAYRAAHPEPFAALERTSRHLPELARKVRDPAPAVAAELRPLGQAALWPLLEALALRPPPLGGASDEQARALGAGLLEAVGVLRDPRAAPVLRAAFARSRSRAVVRAAAAALGRLCDDRSRELLGWHAARRGERALAAVRGLGQCRRRESAEQLAALLEATTEPTTAEAASEALGTIGSSWAWRALGPARADDATAIRDRALAALLLGYAQQHGAAQRAAGRALDMLEHPDTRRRARDLGGKLDPAAESALARIIARIEARIAQRAPQP
jgi:hypothetical protein